MARYKHELESKRIAREKGFSLPTSFIPNHTAEEWKTIQLAHIEQINEAEATTH